MHKLSELTFGAELEVIIPNTVRSEIRQLSGNYGYNFGSDTSISNPNPDIYNTAEIRTNILEVSNGHDLDTFLSFVDVLKSKGVIVNDSTGGHIHIGLQNLVDRKDLIGKVTLFIRLYENFGNIEEALYQVNGKDKRANGQYAKSIKPIIDLMKQDQAIGFMSMRPDHSDRYSALNILSYAEHQTVEFRIFVGSVDSAIWRNNILLAAKFVLKAANRKTLPEFGKDYKALFKYFGLKTSIYGQVIEYPFDRQTYANRNQLKRDHTSAYTSREVQVYAKLFKAIIKGFSISDKRNEAYLLFRRLFAESVSIISMERNIMFLTRNDVITVKFSTSWIEFVSQTGENYLNDISFEKTLSDYPNFTIKE